MKPISAGFDQIAPFYSTLSSIVFGRSLQRSQEHFLKLLKPDDHILILGGGSGDLLQTLLTQHPHVFVDYIDISPRMIQLTKAKTGNFSTVNFIVGTENDIPDQSYDTVITNFYLDLFTPDKLSLIIQKLRAHLKPEGHWLATDFIQEKGWHTAMLWIMYRFFRIVTRIEAQKLPDWRSSLVTAGMRPTHSTEFFSGFIKSTVYNKDSLKLNANVLLFGKEL